MIEYILKKFGYAKTKKATIWQLGSLEHKIVPTKPAMDKLCKILAKNNPEGLHIVWGPDLKVTQVEI